MIFFIVVILGFMGLCLYGIFMPKFMVKQGRIVDARVIFCEQKSIYVGDETGSYYEVTVDFYGLHGETIQRKFQSETPYDVGEVIRSRYIDKSGRFMQEADKDVKNNGVLWFAIGFLVFILALIVCTVALQDENGELPGWFGMGFGYLISILFMGIGFVGLKNKVRLKNNQHRMQVIPGCLVDYEINHGTGDDPDTYQPVYEYELMGMQYQYKSKVSGTAKKYREIGRKVHILRDCETGEIFCQEDEKNSNTMYMVFGIVGLVVFLLLVASSAGLFRNATVTGNTTGISDVGTDNSNTSAGQGNESTGNGQKNSFLLVYVMYPVGENKFSYSIEITESGSGNMILFPSTAVSGKGIDQYIEFKLPISDLVKIGSWMEEADVKNLSLESTGDTDMTITVYATENKETYDGRGTLDMKPYADLFELLSEIVPADVWNEMQEREAAYYE